MHRPRVSLAARLRRAALIPLACSTLLAGCPQARPPLPLDDDSDVPPHVQAHPDAEAMLTHAPPEPTAVAPPEAAAKTLSEEALPDFAALPSQPPSVTTSGTSSTAAAVSAAPAAAAAFSLEAPSPLASIGVSTPPNIAAATRLADSARTKLAAGDDAAALEQLERAIAIDSTNPYAYFFLASLHLRHRTYDQAIAFADRAAGLSQPGSDWASRAYTLQGNAYEYAGRFSDARKAYARAVQAAPNNLAALAGLARSGAPAPNASAAGTP